MAKRIEKILRASWEKYINNIFQYWLEDDIERYGGGLFKIIPGEKIFYAHGEIDILPAVFNVQIIGDSYEITGGERSRDDEKHKFFIFITVIDDELEKSEFRIKRYARALVEILRDHPYLQDPDDLFNPNKHLAKGIAHNIGVVFYPPIPEDSDDSSNKFIKEARVDITYITHNIKTLNQYKYY